MSKNTLNNRVSSCCPEIVKALSAQICELEAKVVRLQTELNNVYGNLALAEYRLEQTQTQRDELYNQFDYYRNNGCEPEKDW